MLLMLTRKAFLRSFQLLLKVVIVTSTVGKESQTFIEEEPIYWADKSELVFDEYVNINLDVNILPPCDLNAFPAGFNKSQQEVDKMRLACTKKFHEMFLLPLTERYKCGNKRIELMPIDTGNKTVSVKLELLVGYGSIFSYSSINEGEDISKMKLGNLTRVDLVNMVESKLSEEGSFADLLELSELKKWDNGWRHGWENAIKTPNMFKYWWDSHAIPVEFFQVIGVEDLGKAFGDILLRPVENLICSLDFNGTNLKVTMTLPKVNRDFRLFHAESFVLTEMYFEHYICELKYRGPENVIWSTEQNCIVAKDVTEAGNGYWEELDKPPFFIQSNSCIPMPNEDKPYFALSACYKRGKWRPEFFFDSKSINQTEYVYCNGGSVRFPTEDDPAIPCPPFVFQTNHTLPIPVYAEDNRKFLSSFGHITVPPVSLSRTLNKMLFPAGFNTTAMLMSQLPILRETKMTKTEKFVVPPAAIAMFIIMGAIILITISVFLLYHFRKFGFTINTNVNQVASIQFWRNRI